MFIIRKENGGDVKITLDELRGKKREDGRFEVVLKDGSKGILMRKDELEKEQAESAQVLIDWIEK